jgi:hydroxylamine reductase (hybrid-cluster protein)
VNVELLPLLVTALSIAGAAGTYAYQKYVDRRTALVEIRRSAYREFLKAFMAMSDSPERVEEIRRRYYQSEVELLIVGSDQVIQKVGALSRFYAETNDDRINRDVREVRRLVAEICRSMRSDCFEKTNLTTDEVQALVPIV